MKKYTKEEQIENRKKWVKALRSGKYEQGRTYLRHRETNAFCCLGVACDISKLGEWKETDSSIRGLGYEVPSDNSEYYIPTGSLPNEVADWLGISEGTGELADRELRSLVNLNDGERYTFDQIADLIESNPPGLFITEDEKTCHD